MTVAKSIPRHVPRSRAVVAICVFTCLAITSESDATDLRATVIRVIDGDSVEVSYVDPKPDASISDAIRLVDIDCPELAQTFGKESKSMTTKLLLAQVVTVVKHGTDRYGRTLASLILIDSRSANEELVKSGACWKYRSSKNVTIKQLEEEARTAKRGLWAQNQPIPPWIYRRKENVSGLLKLLTLEDWPKLSKRERYVYLSGYLDAAQKDTAEEEERDLQLEVLVPLLDQIGAEAKDSHVPLYEATRAVWEGFVAGLEQQRKAEDDMRKGRTQ